MSDLENSNLQPDTASPDAFTLDDDTLTDVYGGGTLLDILNGDLKWCSRCKAFDGFCDCCDVCGEKWCRKCRRGYGYQYNLCWSCAQRAMDMSPYSKLEPDKLGRTAAVYKREGRPGGWDEFAKRYYYVC